MSEALRALKPDRGFLGIEMMPHYYDIARDRLADAFRG